MAAGTPFFVWKMWHLPPNLSTYLASQLGATPPLPRNRVRAHIYLLNVMLMDIGSEVYHTYLGSLMGDIRSRMNLTVECRMYMMIGNDGNSAVSCTIHYKKDVTTCQKNLWRNTFITFMTVLRSMSLQFTYYTMLTTWHALRHQFSDFWTIMVLFLIHTGKLD